MTPQFLTNSSIILSKMYKFKVAKYYNVKDLQTNIEKQHIGF
jgi:hypothetical protein